jgi:GxxExxY protein
MGACLEVYKTMGCGFLEAVYQECLELEFAAQGIPCVAHPWLELAYKEKNIKQQFNPDFICSGKVVVEI